MLEMTQASNIGDASDISEIFKMIETVKSSFKKSGVWSTKKLIKYVPQRLKEVNFIIVKSLINSKLAIKLNKKNNLKQNDIFCYL